MQVVITAMECDKVNRNGRIYPKEVMQKMVDMTNDRVKNGGMYLFAQPPDGGESRIEDLIGTVKEAALIEGKIVIEVNIHGSTPVIPPEFVKEILDNKTAEIIPNAFGSIRNDNTVEVDDVVSYSVNPGINNE